MVHPRHAQVRPPSSKRILEIFFDKGFIVRNNFNLGTHRRLPPSFSGSYLVGKIIGIGGFSQVNKEKGVVFTLDRAKLSYLSW
tara:strand:- start:1230 stop:1478 length:249 start_codon:yes stop_codon:yes gene_type:complete